MQQAFKISLHLFRVKQQKTVKTVQLVHADLRKQRLTVNIKAPITSNKIKKKRKTFYNYEIR